MPSTEALNLHRELFRRQRAEIASALDGARSPALRDYERRYERSTRTVRRSLPLSEVHRRLLASDVVYVGDYHTLPTAQRTFGELVDLAARAGRPLVIGLEFVEARFQPEVERYLAGKLSAERFFARIERDGEHWAPFHRLLEQARALGARVLALDVAAIGRGAFLKRDRFAAERIAAALASPDRPRVMVFTGQFHIAPPHLPAEVAARTQARGLVLFQNCEGAFWTAARRSPRAIPAAVELAGGAICLFTASPVSCQQSFLDHLESLGEPTVETAEARALFVETATEIARAVGVDAKRALAELEVVTSGDADFLDRLRARARFTGAELTQVKRHVLERQSCYFPAARLAYLATVTREHAAEEAAHFVRHLCIGDEMAAPRRLSEAFYARCLEEALGFLGSRLAHPERVAPGLSLFAEAFASDDPEQQAIGAFVLAHKAAEAEGPDAAASMLPLRKDRLFHAVSHALGYLLGDAWHRAYLEGRLGRRELRALFRDPFREPREAYFRLVDRHTVARAS